jgi:uncharacterized alpha-E superfamily protein
MTTDRADPIARLIDVLTQRALQRAARDPREVLALLFHRPIATPEPRQFRAFMGRRAE